MNVSFEKSSPVDGKLIVEVAEADYADKFEKELKKLAKDAKIPGFRNGKVPAGELKRRYGKHIKSDVLNDVVYEAVAKYITDNKLQILGEPLPVAVEEVDLSKPDFKFEYKIGLSPEIDVKVDKDVKLPYYTIEISDEMVKEQDTNLRERFGKQVPGEEADKKALIKGSMVQLNEDGTVNENEGAIRVDNAIVAPFLFTDKKQAELFLGKHVGDKVVFNPYESCNGNETELASMLNIDKDIARDIRSNFEITISEIIVVKLAEHDQEFFDNVFGKDKVSNEEEYETALKDDMRRALESNSVQMFARDADKYLMETYGKDIELPEAFLKEWLVKRHQELTPENIDEEFDKMREGLKWELVSNRAKEALNLTVTEEDVVNYAKYIAAQQLMQYGLMNGDEETIAGFAQRMLENKDTKARLESEIENVKFHDAFRDAVTTEPQTVTLEKFKELAEQA